MSVTELIAALVVATQHHSFRYKLDVIRRLTEAMIEASNPFQAKDVIE
jgi:hypothetical protein